VPSPSSPIRFGAFELDVESGQLLRNRRAVRLKPQPFKLLHLLSSRPGDVVTREEIRQLLWGADTFVDFEQGVNTAIKQIRDALNEDADQPLYVETIPKRGYRFIAPVESAAPAPAPAAPGRLSALRTDLKLHKALWLNIAELRLADVRRRKLRRRIYIALVISAGVLGVGAGLWALVF
jgi:DNA-binding winged helix-turn-helix (wHTH) protein